MRTADTADLGRMWRQLITEEPGLARHLGRVSLLEQIVTSTRRWLSQGLVSLGEGFDPTMFF